MAPLHCRITEKCLADSPKRVPRRINYDLSAITRATRTLFKLAMCSSSPVCVSNYRHEDIRWVSRCARRFRAAGNVVWSGIFNSSFAVADFDKCKRAFTVVFVTAECLNFLLTRTSSPRVLFERDSAMAVVYPRCWRDIRVPCSLPQLQEPGGY